MSKIKNIKIYSSKILKPKKILILSDIHFSKKTLTSLNISKGQLTSSDFKPDFIILAGDIIDSLSEINSYESKEKLSEFLNLITNNIKTYVVLGNHDQMKRLGFDSWQSADVSDYINILSSHSNITILENNKKHLFQEIEIGGFTPSINYYLENFESKEAYYKEFKENGANLDFDKDKFSIFVSHDPISLLSLSTELKTCLNPNTDLTVSGHTHNGLVPYFLQRFMNHYGFVAPSLKHQLFPAHSYGTISKNNTIYLINGAVNSFAEFSLINKIYGINYTNLELLPSKNAQKLSLKK